MQTRRPEHPRLIFENILMPTSVGQSFIFIFAPKTAAKQEILYPRMQSRMFVRHVLLKADQSRRRPSHPPACAGRGPRPRKAATRARSEINSSLFKGQQNGSSAALATTNELLGYSNNIYIVTAIHETQNIFQYTLYGSISHNFLHAKNSSKN